MAFEKGKSGNPDGRKKGSKNKITLDLSEKITQFLDLYGIDEMEADFKTLSPKERLSTFTGLVEFRMAKMQRIEAKIESKDEVKVEQVYKLGNGQVIRFPSS